MKLAEILTDLAKLEAALEESGGEITGEQEQALIELQSKYLDKVDGWAIILDKMAMAEEFWLKRAETAKNTAKALEKATERMKEHLKYVMLERGVKKLEGAESEVTLSPTKGEIVVIDEDAALKHYGKEKLTVSVDKVKLREDLEKGIDFGVAKIKQNWSLKIKPKKGAI